MAQALEVLRDDPAYNQESEELDMGLNSEL